jgi:hypothetical protein
MLPNPENDRLLIGCYAPLSISERDEDVTMCAQCDGFLERRRVNSPCEYRDLVRQIVATVEEGRFKVLSGPCPLETILPTKRWDGDHIIHVLGCSTCSRRFRLSVETDRGCGGAWEVITSYSRSSAQ